MYMKFFNYTQTDENLFKFSSERYINLIRNFINYLFILHIGDLIREKFEEHCRIDETFSKAKFGQLIGVHRTSIYNLFEKHSIDTESLVNFLGLLFIYLSTPSPSPQC